MKIKIKNRILLHICCAPDATVPLDDLELEGWDIAGYFYGSNIQPQGEYVKRLEALHVLMSNHKDIKVIEGGYEPEEWRSHMESLNLIHEPEGVTRWGDSGAADAARAAMGLTAENIAKEFCNLAK